MFYEKELVVNGSKYIRADRAVDYIRELEEEAGDFILKSPIGEEYRMTQEEFYEVSDLFDSDISDTKYIEIENATIHVLNQEQFKKINKILNCYFNMAYMRMEYEIDKIEERNNQNGQVK